MHNTFDETNLIADSFDLEEYLTNINVEFADDFSINQQWACTAPTDQGRVISAAAGSLHSMVPQMALSTQFSNAVASSSAIPMPRFVENQNEVGIYNQVPVAQGGNPNLQHFGLELQLQPLHHSQPVIPQPLLQSSPISPTGSSGPAPALSRSSSGRRQVTPSVSDDDRDAPLPNLSSNATAKERAEHKREQNKRAARRARRKREAQVSRMESDVVRLQREADIWRERARMMEGLLEKSGISVPRFPDDI